jgi:hypothetical protein
MGGKAIVAAGDVHPRFSPHHPDWQNRTRRNHAMPTRPTRPVRFSHVAVGCLTILAMPAAISAALAQKVEFERTKPHLGVGTIGPIPAGQPGAGPQAVTVAPGAPCPEGYAALPAVQSTGAVCLPAVQAPPAQETRAQ